MKLIIETTAKPVEKDGEKGIAFEFTAKSDNFKDATKEEVAAILAYLGDNSVDLLDMDDIKIVVESAKKARPEALDKLRVSLMKKLLRELFCDLADVATKDAEKQPEPKKDKPARKPDHLKPSAKAKKEGK